MTKKIAEKICRIIMNNYKTIAKEELIFKHSDTLNFSVAPFLKETILKVTFLGKLLNRKKRKYDTN